MCERYVGRAYAAPHGCFRLVREVLEDRGLCLPDLAAGVGEDGKAAALLDGLREHARPVDTPEAGDVVLLNVGGRPAHIGVMVSPAEMLHSLEGSGACIERITGLRWRNRVAGFWRV